MSVSNPGISLDQSLSLLTKLEALTRPRITGGRVAGPMSWEEYDAGRDDRDREQLKKVAAQEARQNEIAAIAKELLPFLAPLARATRENSFDESNVNDILDLGHEIKWGAVRRVIKTVRRLGLLCDWSLPDHEIQIQASSPNLPETAVAIKQNTSAGSEIATWWTCSKAEAQAKVSGLSRGNIYKKAQDPKNRIDHAVDEKRGLVVEPESFMRFAKEYVATKTTGKSVPAPKSYYCPECGYEDDAPIACPKCVGATLKYRKPLRNGAQREQR